MVGNLPISFVLLFLLRMQIHMMAINSKETTRATAIPTAIATVLFSFSAKESIDASWFSWLKFRRLFMFHFTPEEVFSVLYKNKNLNLSCRGKEIDRTETVSMTAMNPENLNKARLISFTPYQKKKKICCINLVAQKKKAPFWAFLAVRPCPSGSWFKRKKKPAAMRRNSRCRPPFTPCGLSRCPPPNSCPSYYSLSFLCRHLSKS